MNRFKKMLIGNIVVGALFIALSCIIFFFGNNARMVGVVFSALIGANQIVRGYLEYLYLPYQCRGENEFVLQ